jgi:Met-zincin/Domain of unknown function (DUF5117)/Domain of unknown function (DUF5118)
MLKGVLSAFVICVVVLTVTNLGQEPSAPAQEPAAAAPQRGGRGAAATPEPRPYEQVITKDAKSDTGVFTVHRIKDRVLYEIPPNELDKEFLWVTQIAKTTLGVGYGGQALGNRVVKWSRINNKVFLRGISYDVVASAGDPIAQAVDASNTDTIIMAFDVDAFGPNGSVVIDVTRLFTTDVPEFSARQRLGARGMDTQRSFLNRAVSFPENIEVEATQTYTGNTDNTGGARGGAPNPPNGQRGGGMRGGSATVVLHYSMVKLPEKPMMPRLFDDRVGYFNVRMLDYSQDEHRSPERRFITRWRLEKKDPNAELSEPVKPIVYWIDSATPVKWRPYIKKAIESWQPAFEEAGFKNAIIARQAPTPEEDPDWSAEDARYSVIRWLPSTTENASGPNIHDPRTGEILDSDIQMHHNVMNLVNDWYFIQVGPLDPRAKALPLPDELMGDLVTYVVAHEIGHTLGFQHNMKSSSTYPAEKLRDKDWIAKMGHTPSIMDYSRFNYVAQPEDGIPPSDLIPRIGPYDKWATMWGYKPIPAAKTADDEKTVLNSWIRAQDTTPWLRFSTEGSSGADPGEETEAVGDANAVWSTGLGLKNLNRVGNMLLTATSTKEGEPYKDLEELHGRLLGQWTTEMNHVANVVGGFDSQTKHVGQDGVVFKIIPKERQIEAVKFLNENAFNVPKFALDKEVLRRIEPTGALNRVRTNQQRVLNTLLQTARLQRMIEQEALDGPLAYRPIDFLADLRKGIWSELDAAQVNIDPYRRNLQRTYLQTLDDRLNGSNPVNDDQRAYYRGELRSLNTAINAAIPKSANRETRLHLEDSRDDIMRILDPKFVRPAPAAGARGGRGGGGGF